MIEQRPAQLEFGPGPDLRLRRVHLRSVGPRAARMDPFDLDHTTADGTASRVLWSLTNTGGKTTLLRLITSVIVPGARAQMGGANIGEYVDNGDTAHVVLEWESSGTGRFVTAAVYEWPNRRRPPGTPSMSDLKKFFYTFRCGPIGVDDLPFAVDGRKRTLEEYRTELRELFSSAGALLAPATQLGEWAKVLDSQTPLDPELFRYQMRMNDDESGAEALVRKLGSPDALVRFFIQALNDDTSVTDFNDTLRGYAQQSQRRSAWTAETAFCDALVAGLAPLAGAERRRLDATSHRDGTALALAELAGQLQGRIGADEARRLQLTGLESVAADEEQTLDSQLKRRSDVRQQLLLEEARFDAAAADAALEAALAAQEAAELDRNAWAATGTVARLREARSAVKVCEADYEDAEGQLLPLRTATDRAAGVLAAKYASLAGDADGRAVAETRARKAAEKDLVGAGKRRRNADKEIHKVDADIAEVKRLALELTDARRDAVAAGHLDATESAVTAEQRWDAVLSTADEQRQSLEAAKLSAAARVETAAATTEETAQLLRDARDDRRDADRRLSGYRSELATTSGDPDVAAVTAELLGTDLDGPGTAAALGQDARRHAAEAEHRASVAGTELAEVEAGLDRVNRGQLVSTAADIEAVRSLLVEARIGAVTGWEWLERNIRDVAERRTWIESRPELANGVIITDPQTLDAARELIAAAAPETRIAVHVAPVTATTQAAEGTAGFVVVPHQALWDRAGLEEMRLLMEARRTELSERALAAGAAAETYRRAGGALDAFARRYAHTDETRLEQDATGAAAAEASAASTDEDARTELAVARSEFDAHQNDLLALAESVTIARVAVGECRRLAQLEERTSAAQQQRPVLDERLQRARKEAAAAEEAEGVASAEVTAAVERGTAATGEAQRFRERQAEVAAEPADDVDDRPLVDLESEWRSLREKLTAEEAGSDHAIRLDQAKQRLGDARAEADELDPAARSGAEERLGRLEGASVSSRAAQLQRAEKTLSGANRAHAGADSRAASAAQLVTDREPDDRQVHAPLAPEWVPADRDGAIALIDRVDALTAQDRAALTVVRARLQAVRGQLDEARSDLAKFQLEFDRLDSQPVDGLAAFAGTVEDAADAARNAVGQHRDALAEHQRAQDAWREAVDVVRAVARDAEWVSIDAPIKARCLNAAPDEIGGEAEDWARQLTVRSASLHADLEELDKHRHALVVSLEDLCRTQLRLLAEVTSCSRLPDGLDEMSGHAAFKIDFEKAPPAEARAKLAARVDRWAVALANDPKAVGRGEQRWTWLADAARDLVVERPRAGAWSVQVLKPVIDGTVEYRTPDRIEIEFSGGQELTLAVLLYCTLSQVRAQNRTGGARPPGVLLLDNPFGKASNATLIRIQQALATRAGLQLICATALADPSVKTAFDGDDGRVLELRNDRDQRHGLQYLRLRDPAVSSTVQAAVTRGRDPEDPDGHLDAVAYSVTRT